MRFPATGGLPGVAAALLVTLLALPSADASAQTELPPSPVCPDARSRQFDFWVGEWDVLNRHRRPESDDPIWYETGTAIASVGPVVGGCAIVERWDGTLTFDRVVGFSVRAFDPAREVWDLVLLWPSANRPVFATFVGEFRHGRGEFEAGSVDQHDRPQITRITFADIGPDALRWDLALSGDSGITWRTTWIMEFARRSATATPPPPAAPDSAPRCDFPQMYEFAFALGRWAGTATLQDGTAAPATLESRTMLGGCGIEDRMIVGGGAWEGYEVRTFDPLANAWVAYRLDSARPVLQRLDGSVRRRDAQFAGSRAGANGDVLVSALWRFVGESALRYDLRESVDGGDTWTTLLAAQLDREGDSP